MSVARAKCDNQGYCIGRIITLSYEVYRSLCALQAVNAQQDGCRSDSAPTDHCPILAICRDRKFERNGFRRSASSWSCFIAETARDISADRATISAISRSICCQMDRQPGLARFLSNVAHWMTLLFHHGTAEHSAAQHNGRIEQRNTTQSIDSVNNSALYLVHVTCTCLYTTCVRHAFRR